MRNRHFNYIAFTLFIVFIFISAIPIFLPLLTYNSLLVIEIPKPLSNYLDAETPLLNVSSWMLTVLFGCFSVKLRKAVLKPETYCRDEYFVDRVQERSILFSFLERDNKDNGALFFLKGGMCRGKSILIKRFADDVNRNIRMGNLLKNYPEEKQYSAYYVPIDGNKNDIFLCISQILHNDDSLNTCEKVVRFIKKASYRSKVLLIIDNICKEQSRAAIEAAHALLYKSAFLKIILVITVDTKIEESDALIPPLFGEMHIQELSQVYNKPLSSEEQQQILRISGGIPSYVRMLFDTKVSQTSFQLSNIEDIQHVIKNQFETLADQKKIVVYLSYLNLCYEGGIPKKDILDISESPEDHLSSVLDTALAHEYKQHQKSYIRMDSLVAGYCRQFGYPDDVLKDICSFYFKKDTESDIALTAMLMLHVQEELNVPKDIFRKKYAQNDFFFFVKLGRLDQENKLVYLNENKEFNNEFRYYHLNSLLQLGQYSQAIDELKRYESSEISLPSLRKTNDLLGFEMQYLIIDLHHLSNQFDLALDEIDALLSQKENIKEDYMNRFLYLKAHCIKHKGDNLPLADSILQRLSEKKLTQTMRVRVLYSHMAIHLFWGNKSFPYESTIQMLRDTAEKNSPEQVHMQRHIANYYWKIQNNSHEALNIINSCLEQLEKTRWRIIYDFYFEKAELMRIQNEEKTAKHDINAILHLYDQAIDFAEENKDINLACCSRLGKILTLWSSPQNSAAWRKKQFHIVEDEYEKVKEADLLINSAYAAYVKFLLSDEKPLQEFLIYCKQNNYYDLVKQIDSPGILKLTVM
ncbi:hypothetical protein ABFV83_01815 [Lacrimispora sp. BS-2]|uniref:ATP-binding protein n=1 Tax=Lacrimispora sp. BS-2 TaxID=3151850 RepID=A0AAU7PR65_9FIRM